MPSIRKALQDRPKLSIGISIAFALLAAALIYYELQPPHTPTLDKAFYTDDDGNTTFIDDLYLAPPFTDANGKTAVWAVEYSYAGGSKQYVAYLRRYKADIKKQVEDSIADAKKQGLPPQRAEIFNGGMTLAFGYEIKKAKDPKAPWIDITDNAARDIMASAMKSPDGTPVTEQALPIDK